MGRPPKLFAPTDREIDALHALWDLRFATVAQVQSWMNDQYEPEIAYTTALSLLQSLHAKGLVDRERHAQRHVYQARLSREKAINNALDNLVEVLCVHGERELMDIMQERAALARRRAELAREAARQRAEQRARHTPALAQNRAP